ncbi:MAG: CHAT domain-containing tetratricopeptide repeat protein [Fuerstiella sp.]
MKSRPWIHFTVVFLLTCFTSGFLPNFVFATSEAESVDYLNNERLHPDITVTGDCVFRDGFVEMSSDAALAARAKAGPQFELNLALKADETNQREASQLIVQLYVDARTTLSAQIDLNAAGKITSVIIRRHHRQNSGEWRWWFVAQEALESPVSAQKLTLRFSYGFIQVLNDQNVICQGYRAPGYALTGWRLWCAKGSCTISGLRLEYSPSRPSHDTVLKRLASAESLDGDLCPQVDGRRRVFSSAGSDWDVERAIEDINRGEYCSRLHFFDEAFECYSMGRKTLEENDLTRHPAFAYLLRHEAWSKAVVRQFEESEDLFARAIELNASVFGEESSELGWTVCLHGTQFYLQRSYQKAISAYDRATDIGRKNNNASLQSNATTALAMTYQSLGDASKAESYYQQALDLSGTDTTSAADIHVQLSRVYTAAKRFDEAEALLRNAIRIFERDYEPISYYPWMARVTLAWSQLLAGKEDAAGQNFRFGVDAAGEIYGKRHHYYLYSLSGLAAYQEASGDWHSAIQTRKEELELSREILTTADISTAKTARDLGEDYLAVGDYDKALLLARESIDSASRAGRAVIPALSASEAQRWLDSSNGFEDLLMSAFLATDDADPRDAYFTRWPLRERLIRLRPRISADSSDPDVRRMLTDLSSARRRLAALAWSRGDYVKPGVYSARMQAVLRQIDEIEHSLTGVSDQHRVAIRYRDAVPGQLTDVLDKTTAIVEFVRFRRFIKPLKSLSIEVASVPSQKDEGAVVGRFQTKDSYGAFVVSLNSAHEVDVQYVDVGEASVIDKDVSAWTSGLNESGNAKTVDSAGKASRLIWSPLAPITAGFKHLVVVPVAGLSAVPWGAILHDDKYLLELHRISVCSSPHVLCRSQNSETTGIAVKNSVILGALDYGDSSPDELNPITPLPGTAAEVQAVQQLARDAGELSPVLLTGTSATESDLMTKLQECSHFHIASHGVFIDRGLDSKDTPIDQRPVFGNVSQESAADRNPLLSVGLLLSNVNEKVFGSRDSGTADDGLLTGEELLGLDLTDCDLAVLSACETARGTRREHETEMSLQRALHAAGVDSVVASLLEIGVQNGPTSGVRSARKMDPP